MGLSFIFLHIMTVGFQFRTYLSVTHLSAAALFAKQCRLIEDSPRTAQSGNPDYRQHSAFALSSVILSAAFLEATINELFCDCADENKLRDYSSLPSADLMGRLWKKNVPRTAAYSILEKYEIALELNAKPCFSTGSTPYQDIKLLVELRNAYIHYEPETIDGPFNGDPSKVHKFEKRLVGKFKPNSLVGIGNPFYPDKVMSAGCAEWAVKSSVAFTDVFFEKMGIAPRYADARRHFLNEL